MIESIYQPTWWFQSYLLTRAPVVVDASDGGPTFKFLNHMRMGNIILNIYNQHGICYGTTVKICFTSGKIGKVFKVASDSKYSWTGI